jgi:hypothetical protein
MNTTKTEEEGILAYSVVGLGWIGDGGFRQRRQRRQGASFVWSGMNAREKKSDKRREEGSPVGLPGRIARNYRIHGGEESNSRRRCGPVSDICVCLGSQN